MGLHLLRSRGRKPLNRDRTLKVDGEAIHVRVVEHATSKRITLRLMPGGDGLKVTMPAHVSDPELDAFLERNRHWVATRRARLPRPVALGADAVIPYLGIPHRIVATGKLRGLVETDHDAEGPVLRVPGEGTSISRKLESFFKRQARMALDSAVARHAASLDVRPRQIRITDTTSRWGSCSTTRTLSFSWRIILAPPEVLDYLAAHEVAHLREMNHSDRFWALVKELCPQMEQHKTWLRRHGASLHAVTLAG